MSPRIYNESKLGAPALAHTLTESAEAAREAVRAEARRRRAGRLVTEHPKRHSGVVPPAAERFVHLALAVGFEVKVVEGWQTMNAGRANASKAEAIQVAGIDRRRRRGFRATWVRGKAGMGVWYEVGVTPRTGKPVGIAGVVERVNGCALG